MTRDDLQKIFESEFSWNNWKQVMNFVFPEFKFNLVQTDLARDTKAHKKDAGFIKEHGQGRLKDDVTLALCEVLVTDKVRLDRNIKSVRSLVADLAIPNFQTIVAVFHNADNSKWRFTLVVREFIGSGKVVDKKPESYTYVFGVGERGRTASERFIDLAGKSNKTLKDLEEAFSVTALSKKFFKEYKAIYQKFVDDVVKSPSKLALFKENTKEKQEKSARDFVKKMMGRLIFLYFLQKKGWLGCKTKWKDGDEQFMKRFEEKAQLNDSFYHQFLEPLFFDTLNAKREKEDEDCVIQKINFGKVPYLNGGLFEKDENHPTGLTLSWKIFTELFDTLNSYNFTIIEDDPEFKEVAVDPEMLGHIFENLLEDHKDKTGAFYTPKEIVHYMCQESLYEYLKTYLQHHNHWPKDEYEQRVLENSLQRFVRLKLAGGIIDYDKPLATALRRVKVCDPAIGSGAFPMGLLNEIYRCVHKLYEENPDSVGKIWEINKGWNGYIVKRRIIQNSIYGVDVEKGAVDIARLRFWLSLIIDETEPTPLPNLDYKIMQGNSLLESFEGVIDLRFDKRKYVKAIEKPRDLFGNIEEKNKQISLAEAMAASDFDLMKSEEVYFGEQNIEEKNKIRKQITEFEKRFINDQIKEKENDLIYNISIISKKLNTKRYNTALEKRSSEKLLKKYEEELIKVEKAKELIVKIKEGTKPYFLWSLYFLDVMEAGGFDIVIGNPPYIQMQRDNGLLAEMLKDKGFETYERTGDIYSIFYEKGFHLLKDNGTHTFITSSQWLRANYGKSLQTYFLKYNPKKLLLLGPGIFESATVDTNILIAQKCVFKNELRGKEVESAQQVMQISNSDFLHLADVKNGQWAILNSIEQAIKTKLIQHGKPLRDWKITINRGVLTGLNEAFIIDSEKRKELISAEPKCKKLIKSILRGREIEKYHTDWDGKYLIFIPWHFPLDEDPEIEGASRAAENAFKNEYPVLYKYFLSHKDALNNRNKAETGIRYEWYALQRCAATYKEVFKEEKIVWKRIGSSLRFSYFDYEIYNLDSTCIATGEKIKYLTGLLNSKLANYQLLETAQRTGMGDLLISVQALEPLLVHYPSEKEEQLVIQLVDKIIEKKKEEKDATALEQKLDAIVYKLYNLSYEEVKFIDSDFALTEKEYSLLKF